MPYNKQIMGWMIENDLKALEELALQVPKSGTIVEVGSYMGRSSVCWAMTAPSATVYCVDEFFNFSMRSEVEIPDEIAEMNCHPKYGQFYNPYQEFIKNTKDYKNIIPITGHVPDISLDVDEIDLLFLDANHKNPNDWDILTYFVPKIKSGGIISGHDYSHAFPDVIKNVSRLEQIIDKPRTLYFKTEVWSFVIDKKITKEQMDALKYQP